MTDQPLCEVFMKIGDLAFKRGHIAINVNPFLFVMRIDDDWVVRINAHRESIMGVPAFHMAVEWHGWPAGLFSAAGGIMAAGSLANENTLIAAIDKAIAACDQKGTS